MDAVFFQGGGVSVTDKIVSVPGGQTFFLSQLSSVRVVYEDNLLSRVIGVCTIAAGLLIAAFGIAVVATVGREGFGPLFCSLITAFLFACFGALILLIYRPRYWLVLVQSSGEARAVSHTDASKIRAIEAAVVQAMGAR